DHLLERAALEPAGIAGVAVVALLAALVARHLDLLRADHHDEVAGGAVRRVLRLALAAEGIGDLRGEAAERLAAGIDEQPVALGGRGGGHERRGHYMETGAER